MRTLVRECVYKLLFAYLFTGEWDDFLKATIFQEAKLDEKGIAFAEQLLAALKNHADDVRGEVTEYSTAFSQDRIFKADLCALIFAVTELKYVGGVDAPVIVDQAVSLSRKFSAENSPSFVNGILAEYLRKNF